MRPPRPFALVLVLALLSALFIAACGGGSDDEPSAVGDADVETEAGSGNATATQAADLRAGLTHLLVEHVNLAGIAFVQAAENGLDSQQFEAAADTLDQNSQELADTLGSVYGDDAGDQFLELWRAHIGMFVDYTEGKLTGNNQQVNRASEELDGYRTDFGAFIESATEGGLSQDAVAEALQPHTQSVEKTIDNLAAGEGNAFVDLQDAAGHMPDIAAVLSGAIVEQNEIDGDPNSGAAELRADLTGLLDGHVYAAGIALTQALGNGPDSPEAEAATEALDDNTEQLTGAISSIYNEGAGDQFRELWNAHIGMFVDYTLATAEGDEQGIEAAREDLDGYRRDFGAFLESATEGELSQEAVEEALDPHVELLTTAIDSAADGDPAVFDDLKEAADHNVDLAAALAGGFAAQSPNMFGDGS